MNSRILAIDPGASGGLAFGDNRKPPMLISMPETLHDLIETIRGAACDHAFVELVGGYVGKAQPASSAFNFGQNYGQILGVLAALEVPYTLVRPQAWQKSLSLGTSTGMSKTEWKNKLKAKAQQLYPNIKITLSTADACLIWHAAKTDRIQP
jgi:hypothetical protein